MIGYIGLALLLIYGTFLLGGVIFYLAHTALCFYKKHKISKKNKKVMIEEKNILKDKKCDNLKKTKILNKVCNEEEFKKKFEEKFKEEQILNICNDEINDERIAHRLYLTFKTMKINYLLTPEELHQLIKYKPEKLLTKMKYFYEDCVYFSRNDFKNILTELDITDMHNMRESFVKNKKVFSSNEETLDVKRGFAARGGVCYFQAFYEQFRPKFKEIFNNKKFDRKKQPFLYYMSKIHNLHSKTTISILSFKKLLSKVLKSIGIMEIPNGYNYFKFVEKANDKIEKELGHSICNIIELSNCETSFKNALQENGNFELKKLKSNPNDLMIRIPESSSSLITDGSYSRLGRPILFDPKKKSLNPPPVLKIDGNEYKISTITLAEKSFENIIPVNDGYLISRSKKEKGKRTSKIYFCNQKTKEETESTMEEWKLYSTEEQAKNPKLELSEKMTCKHIKRKESEFDLKSFDIQRHVKTIVVEQGNYFLIDGGLLKNIDQKVALEMINKYAIMINYKKEKVKSL